MPEHRRSRAVLFAASLLLSSVPAVAESLPAYPFIHVTGNAFLEVMPDIGALDFEVVALDADPADGGPRSGPIYELRYDVHINVRKLDTWPALAGGLLGKPNLDGFASSFDLSTRSQTADQLLSQAVADARHLAAVIAAADGRKLGALTAASPQALKNLTNSMGLQRGDFRIQRSAGNARPQNLDPERDRAQFLIVHALKLGQPVDAIFRLEGAAKRGR